MFDGWYFKMYFRRWICYCIIWLYVCYGFEGCLVGKDVERESSDSNEFVIVQGYNECVFVFVFNKLFEMCFSKLF